MTAQPRKHRDREPGPAAFLRRASGPQPPEGNIAAGTASRAGRDSHGGWLAYSVHEAARLTGLSNDLLYDQTRLSNLACVKVGMWRLITCQHLQQFPGIAS
jgi:hypothetical protein